MEERICDFPECGRRHDSRGLCKSHAQQQRNGFELTPLIGRGRSTRPPIEEAFLARIDQSGDCWEWQGSKDAKGYGVFKHAGTRRPAHRYSFEIANGIDLSGSVVDHLCHNPGCVNPAHLRAADHTKNMQNRKGPSSNSRSGIRNVYFENDSRKWVALVAANNKRYRKRFSNPADAEAWATKKREELHR